VSPGLRTTPAGGRICIQGDRAVDAFGLINFVRKLRGLDRLSALVIGDTWEEVEDVTPAAGYAFYM